MFAVIKLITFKCFEVTLGHNYPIKIGVNFFQNVF